MGSGKEESPDSLLKNPPNVRGDCFQITRGDQTQSAGSRRGRVPVLLTQGIPINGRERNVKCCRFDGMRIVKKQQQK